MLLYIATKKVERSKMLSYKCNLSCFTSLSCFKNLEEITVSEISRNIPPKILFGGAGGSGVLRDIAKKKINKGGLELLAKNESSVRLPEGQWSGTMKSGGEI